jgi:pimeloyl-ACP methyl ester carboxylesterase
VRKLTLTRPDGRLAGTEVGTGPPVILLHAGGERGSVWSSVEERLASHGYRSIAWDQRGHGESSAPDIDHLPPFAGDVAAMVASLDASPVLVGASLGGLAAMLALADRGVRDRVAGLVLVDVVPDPDPARVRAYLSATTGDLASHPIVEDILGRADALRSAARKLDLPTLLVRGGRSTIVEDEVASFLELAPAARVRVIENAGHLVAQDAPLELADQIAVHLAAPDVVARRS